MTPLADVQFAWRTWRKHPLPPLAAIVTLALGVGANTTIFSVIHAVMLKPLPYTEPGRLAQIWSVDLDAHREKQMFSAKEIDRFRGASRTFQDIGYYRPWMSNISAAGSAERIYTALVSPGFLTTLQLPPAMGRAFTDRDMIPGKNRVVILSDAFWRRRFNSDPAVLTRTITVDGFPCTIIGVLGRGVSLVEASLGAHPELLQPASVILDIRHHPESVFAFGRLRPGVPLESASAEMNSLLDRLQPDEDVRAPGQHAPRNVRLVPLADQVASGIRPALLILFAVAGCVLLIACGNIASLLLASTAAREGELALRTALGARRGRLARQLLTEAIALSLAGTAIGLLLSSSLARTIVHLYPDRIPRAESLHPEPAVFVFTALVSIITAVLFGGLPAWRYSRSDVQPVLRGSASGGRQTGGLFRDILMIAQTAAALVLLIGAGLLLRSFVLLRAVDPGYQRRHLLVAHMMLDDKSYREPQQQAAFVDRLIARLDTLPGVDEAGASDSLPLDYNFLMSVGVGIEGHPELGDRAIVDCRSVTPRFLQTLGIALVAGRYLALADGAVGGGMMVNQAFARKYFPNANPIGLHVYAGPEPRPIVGVVADVRDLQLDRQAVPVIYAPFGHLPTAFVDLAVRTATDPKSLVNAVRAELRRIDPNQPLGKVTTMEDVLDAAVAKPRWYALLIGSFAGLAMLLAAVGIYGVVAYAVGRRTHEIGIRMAIGAEPGDVLRMMLWRGMLPPLIGVAIGVPLAAAASKVLASFLYAVKPIDFETYLAVALIVSAVALVAAYLPARRATRVDPLTALRCE